MSEVSFSKVLEVIQNRKSIRSYSSREIEKEKLEKILEAGRLAPSWQNKQCWHFIVIQTRETIKHLALKSGVLSKTNFFMKDAPVVIVACADPQKSGYLNGQYYYLVDTAIAFQHMMLVAWELGIGSCWMGAFNEEKIKEILHIPKNIRVVALSPFGYPAQREGMYSKVVKAFAGSKRRKSIDEIVHWNEW